MPLARGFRPTDLSGSCTQDATGNEQGNAGGTHSSFAAATAAGSFQPATAGHLVGSVGAACSD